MIQSQLKLRLTRPQERTLEEWLLILTSVWNWSIRKIELNARDGIYFSEKEFHNLLAGHGAKLGIPSHTLQGMLSQAWVAWRRCFKKLGRKPRLKGQRNRLNSIPFPDPLHAPDGDRISIPGVGRVRFHKMALPDGKIKCGRIVRRASGWYVCLVIDTEREPIERRAFGQVGIDPGFHDLITLSTGEKVGHPRELECAEKRLAQAQRGNRHHLVARLQERIACQRKDRNHKLSLRLVQDNALVAFSADHRKGMARTFGKSVMSSGHAQLRSMLAYKSRAGGTLYVEPDAKNSTRTCSACGCLSGPTGWRGLSVRQWVCADCGSLHDRDVNAAVNTLTAGVGMTHESSGDAASGIPRL
jgi:putative transposase